MSLVRWTHMGNRLSVSIDTDRSDMIHYVGVSIHAIIIILGAMGLFWACTVYIYIFIWYVIRQRI